jgi:hypothetical protein
VSGVSPECTEPPNGRRTKWLDRLERLGTVGSGQCCLRELAARQVTYQPRCRRIPDIRCGFDVGGDVSVFVYGINILMLDLTSLLSLYLMSAPTSVITRFRSGKKWVTGQSVISLKKLRYWVRYHSQNSDIGVARNW